MIVQLRASMGAGKSTLMRQLLRDHDAETVEEHVFTRPNGKLERIPLWRCDGELYVLGRYDLEGVSPGGGGDKINGPVGVEVVRHYAHLPHLVWESAWGSLETPREELRGLDIVWAVLDTPAEECVRRIAQRRIERNRNVGKSLDEDRVRANHRRVHRIAASATAGDMWVVSVDHLHAYEQLHGLLAAGGWRCECHTVAGTGIDLGTRLGTRK